MLGVRSVSRDEERMPSAHVEALALERSTDSSARREGKLHESGWR